jgi:large subunit ribosomal protein L7/L12|tara:strand:+ start:2625 stop:3002 length:378 start_codon:yes stop_codon:yes gene_type:complete
MALSKEEILEAIAEMSVIDVVELIEAMEEKFGVSAAAPVAAAAPAAGGAEAEEEAAADVDIHLAEIGDKKVEVIKAVRAITGLGLKDAKGLVDTAPSIIKEGVNKAEADEYAKQLEDAGAKVELK